MTAIEHDQTATRFQIKKLDAAGWGLFFIWIGLALLANFGWDIGLLGVGMIILGMQAARKSFGLPVEVFWLIVGLLFVVSSVWEFFEPRIPGGLWPIVSIAVGVMLFVSAFLRKREDH